MLLFHLHQEALEFLFTFLHKGGLICISGEGNGNPLQCSCLENPMDGGAWWAAVHGVAKSWTRLSNFTFTFYFHALEKEMATHSSILAWRIPGTKEPGGRPSMGSPRVGHNWSDLAAAAGAASPCLRLLIFLPAVVIPACVSSSPAFHMMYSAYKLNKQGDNIHPWHTPFPIWNQCIFSISSYNCCFLTCIQIPQEAVRWSGVPTSLRIFHILLWST